MQKYYGTLEQLVNEGVLDKKTADAIAAILDKELQESQESHESESEE